MSKASQILRLISLALLFGGSTAVVFVAVILVKAAKANGVPVEEAAAVNAPAFIEYAKILAGAAIALLIGEGLDFADKSASKGKLTLARYATSALCAVTAFVFAFAIVPPMDGLREQIKSDATAKAKFHELHEVSRGVFGATILFALISLLLPAFQGRRSPDGSA